MHASELAGCLRARPWFFDKLGQNSKRIHSLHKDDELLCNCARNWADSLGLCCTTFGHSANLGKGKMDVLLILWYQGKGRRKGKLLSPQS